MEWDRLNQPWNTLTCLVVQVIIVTCVPSISNDEDMADKEENELVKVLIGPITRARAKRFKEEINNLILKLQTYDQDSNNE